jgi:predicted NBD/HSP70 family sugar kinase
MDVLVIDVGGSNVKMRASGDEAPRRFRSGTSLTPGALVAGVQDAARGWRYDVISLGVPGRVGARGPEAEPGNLGDGWIGFDFEQAFGKPVRLVNDAVMQALGAYRDGRMLFLGLGTGLGSALVSEHVVVPLELGSLPFRSGGTLADRLGRAGLRASGLEQWTADVHEAAAVLRTAFAAEQIVLGGGNAKLVAPLPPGTRRGSNDDAFTGGIRLWEERVELHDQRPHRVWRVVR